MRKTNLVAHNSGQMFEKLLKGSKLFATDSDDGPLEELVRVDEKSNFFGALFRRNVNQRRSMLSRYRRRRWRHWQRRLRTRRSVFRSIFVVNCCWGDAFLRILDADFSELNASFFFDGVVTVAVAVAVDQDWLRVRNIVQTRTGWPTWKNNIWLVKKCIFYFNVKSTKTQWRTSSGFSSEKCLTKYLNFRFSIIVF